MLTGKKELDQRTFDPRLDTAGSITFVLVVVVSVVSTVVLFVVVVLLWLVALPVVKFKITPFIFVDEFSTTARK